jgi:hypothetical protein
LFFGDAKALDSRASDGIGGWRACAETRWQKAAATIKRRSGDNGGEEVIRLLRSRGAQLFPLRVRPFIHIS